MGVSVDHFLALTVDFTLPFEISFISTINLRFCVRRVMFNGNDREMRNDNRVEIEKFCKKPF